MNSKMIMTLWWNVWVIEGGVCGDGGYCCTQYIYKEILEYNIRERSFNSICSWAQEEWTVECYAYKWIINRSIIVYFDLCGIISQHQKQSSDSYSFAKKRIKMIWSYCGSVCNSKHDVFIINIGIQRNISTNLT